MRVAVWGAGAVGARAARQLASSDGVERILVAARRPDRRLAVCASLGEVAVPFEPDAAALIADGCDAIVLATPPGDHGALAGRFLAADMHVVSASDGVPDVEALLDLDGEARERGRSVVAGAGFSPGLSCLLAAHLAGLFHRVSEVHVATTGAGGPACARQRHRARAGRAVQWRDGGWVERRAGSGGELCWFPDPVGGLDCYFAVRPDPLLLVRAVPGAERVTARLSATGAERLTARLPMLRRLPTEGGLGALRVEVRGSQGGVRGVQVYGAIDRPALATGTVAAVTCAWAVEGRLSRLGAGGLAELAPPRSMLTELARRGIKAAVFEGAAV